MRISFQDEMKQMFLRVAAGEVEPEEWGKWWNSNRDKLEENLPESHRERTCRSKNRQTHVGSGYRRKEASLAG